MAAVFIVAAIALGSIMAWVEFVVKVESQAQGILYRVRHEGVTVYLLGSIHIGNREMYPFGETLLAAMEASNTFVFECDTTSGDALAATRKAKYFQDGTKLTDVLPADLYEKLEAVSSLRGYSVSEFVKMKPWAVMSTLSMDATAAQMGMDSLVDAASLGVEVYVRGYASKNKKEIGHLETTEEQLGVMDGFSMPLQEYLLESTLNAILEPATAKGMDASMGEWPGWWKAGNAAAFAQSFHQGEEQETRPDLAAEYCESLIYKRNVNMADRTEALLLGGGEDTYFVTVGLLHLVLPEHSVVKCLEDKGYTVEWLGTP